MNHDISTVFKPCVSKVTSLAETIRALLYRSVVTSWLPQPCSDASVYHVDHLTSQYLPVLYGFFCLFVFFYSAVKIPSLQLSFGVVVFVDLVKLAQGACLVANYANRVIKVQYCCYCHGELNSEFKNISVQLCICYP